MRFWKDPSHVLTLFLYVLITAVIGGVCFAESVELGLIVTVICVMFTILHLVAAGVQDTHIRALRRRLERTMQDGTNPDLPGSRRGELYELDRCAYRLALQLSDCRAARRAEREENDALLLGIAGHVIVRADELPANVHRRELIALAHDMERLAALHRADAPVASDALISAGALWQDALVMAGETIRLQQITVQLDAHANAYVSCPRAIVVGGLCGLLETCARHADVGSCWTCTARETPAFTEFRISGDRFDWSTEQLTSLFDSRSGAEPALVYLSRVASVWGGEVRAERTEGCVCHLIFRLYQQGAR